MTSSTGVHRSPIEIATTVAYLVWAALYLGEAAERAPGDSVLRRSRAPPRRRRAAGVGILSVDLATSIAATSSRCRGEARVQECI